MSGAHADSQTDRAVLAAFKAWAGAEEPALLLRLGHQRARELGDLRKQTRFDDSLDALKAAHLAQMRPDLARVHHSWLARALKDESASVQRSVVAAQDEPLRGRLITALRLDASSLEIDHPPAAFAVEAATALWTERLVGDVARLDTDSPVIKGLTTLPNRSLYRLARLTGLTKLWKLGEMSGRNIERAEWMSARLADPSDERLIALAVRDWQEARGAGKFALAAFGLVTWARLLAHEDDYRLRWVLQHLPYPVVKRVRGLAAQPRTRVCAVVDWERQVFKVAWDRLRIEEKSAR